MKKRNTKKVEKNEENAPISYRVVSIICFVFLLPLFIPMILKELMGKNKPITILVLTWIILAFGFTNVWLAILYSTVGIILYGSFYVCLFCALNALYQIFCIFTNTKYWAEPLSPKGTGCESKDDDWGPIRPSGKLCFVCLNKGESLRVVRDE